MRRIFLVIAVIFFVTLISGGIYWYFVLSKQPTSIGAPSPTPTPVKSTSPCKDFETLAYIKYSISCKKALELALKQAQGNIIGVSIEPAQVPFLDTSPPEIRTIDIWAIDISLAKPVFDKDFNREVHVWRIGIPVDGYKLIHRKPLK